MLINTTTLDNIIQLNTDALAAIEAADWDTFIAIENDRQRAITAIDTTSLTKDDAIIQRIKEIKQSNEVILKAAVAHQENLQQELKKSRKTKMINKAYQQ